MFGRFVLVFFGGIFALAASIGAVAGPNAVGVVPGEILVKAKSGRQAHLTAQLATDAETSDIGVLPHVSVRRVRVPKHAELRVARALSRNPNVEFAEPNWLLAPNDLPDDPLAASSWHLAKVGANAAWDLSHGDNVTVAVLDSGIHENHPDLAGKVLSGWNTASNNSDTSDIFGHGTKVAGVIGAATANGLGVAGLGWNANILPVRVTNRSDGVASTSAIASGIAWASANGARIANVSFDFAGSSTISFAAGNMRDAGGIVVGAAGNTGTSKTVSSEPDVLFVSATTANDTRPSWSSFGDYVDVSAPGVGIYTTSGSSGYGTASGTSFSAPLTAAVLALMQAANPSLTMTQQEALLISTVVDLGDTGYDQQFGHGRVDAAAAVAAAASAVGNEDTTPPTVAFSEPTASSTVSGITTVTVAAADAASGIASVALYVDGGLFNTDATAPYAFGWDTTALSDGLVQLTAVATDNAGNSTDATVSVAVSNNIAPDTTAPDVVIDTPSGGATVSRTVQISAHATDDTAIVTMSVRVDGTHLCSSGQSTISCGWNSRKTASGSHEIQVTAADSAGNTTSVSVEVIVSGGGSSGPKGGGKGGGRKK